MLVELSSLHFDEAARARTRHLLHRTRIAMRLQLGSRDHLTASLVGAGSHGLRTLVFVLAESFLNEGPRAESACNKTKRTETVCVLRNAPPRPRLGASRIWTRHWFKLAVAAQMRRELAHHPAPPATRGVPQPLHACLPRHRAL